MYKFRKTYISTKGESENFYDVVPENITVNYNMPYSSNSLVLSNEQQQTLYISEACEK